MDLSVILPTPATRHPELQHFQYLFSQNQHIQSYLTKDIQLQQLNLKFLIMDLL